MLFNHHFFKSITSTCKSAIAIATAFLAGCTPKVEYPTDNEMAQNDQNTPSKTSDPSTNAAEENSAQFIPYTPNQTSSAYIETYSIRAKIIGRVAQIETEFTLRNPDPTSVGGELDIPLPEGAVVTGYAMDLRDETLGLKAANTQNTPTLTGKASTLTDGGHTMVDAVMIGHNYGCRGGYTPTEPPTPSPNHFAASIDTILPHGYRMVRLVYTVPLKLHSDGTTSVLLPMQKHNLRKRTIQISVDNAGTEPPILNENIGNHFQKDGSEWVLEQTDDDIISEKDLTLSFPAVSGEVFQANKYIEHDLRHPDEWFVMFDIHIGQNQASPQDLSHIRLIWDASSSRTPEDIKQAIEVVRRLPENSLYELHVFHHQKEPARTFQNRSELIQYLETIPYDGSTNYMSLEGIVKSDFDGVTLIFTDGVDAYHKSIPAFGKHSLVLLSGKVIHENDVWTASHGHIIRINESTLDEVLAEIQKPRLSVFNVTGSHISDTQWIERGAKDRISAIAKWDGTSDTVTIQLTDGTTFTAELQETDKVHEDRVLSATWAIHKIRALSERSIENESLIHYISRKYTVPSPFTQLAILTNLEQYEQLNVEPPNSLPDIHQAWLDILKDREAYRLEHRHEKRVQKPTELDDDLLKAWDNYVDWWKHPLPQKLDVSYLCNSEQTECWKIVNSELGFHYINSFQPPKDWDCKKMKNCEAANTELPYDFCGFGGGGSVTTTYGPRACQKKDMPIIIATFGSKDENDEIMSWDPNTPYLTSMEELQKKGANAESLYTEYLRWQPKYARSSAFYFDVANYFFSENMPSYGIRILSNLFEHSFDNNPERASCENYTDKYVIARAYVQRLINAGELDEALRVLEAFYSPDDPEPQSCSIIAPQTSPEWLLKLATLLDMRARKTNNPDDAQRAIEYYHRLSFSSYEDISFPSIVQFNSLRAWIIQNHFNLNIPSIPKIDQQLSKPLDVDMRIVVESESEYRQNRKYVDGFHDTLVFVTEPTSERLPHYGCSPDVHIISRSAIGGMIGNNTYVIKKAEKGEYILSVDITGMEDKDLLGLGFTTITLYRNWGRPNQTQEIIVKRRRLATLDEKDNEKETVVVKIE